MRLVLIFSFFLMGILPVCAQNEVIPLQPWSISIKKESPLLPEKTRLQFQLNHSLLAQKLIQAPARNRYKKNPVKTVLFFPLPNGEFQRFLIEEANNFHPSLAKKFPSIQAYAGSGIDDASASIRFSFSNKGLTGFIQSGKYETVLIDPINTNSPNLYKVQFKKDLQAKAFNCTLKEVIDLKTKQKSTSRNPLINCELRKYRLALGCTGEYAQYHGGTVEDALIAMNNTLTIVNGIFEKDMAISLELVPNTTDLIYLNPQNDPYTNIELVDMLGENQRVCDAEIGTANYDIGHVFGTGLGGVAFLGVLCEENYKASGATGFPRPEGPIFAIDLVAHELGHQFGAAHTFNGDRIACAGANRNKESSVEPGSGSTIMGYAGICPPQDVQDHSDAYFHAVSLQQMKEVINSTNCATAPTNFDNTAPIIVAAPDLYYIPNATPFALSLNATDVENKELTYTWEQMDAGIGAIPPISTNKLGPMFRSMLPSESPIRYFPSLANLTKNSQPTWEVLPTVERTMNFRGTVRDNNPRGGCYEFMNLEVMVEVGRPFQVSYPNAQETWQAGTEKTILWEVGNTAQMPINTEEVAILLSTDGGFTYPITLKEKVPNTGRAIIVVPNEVISTARIMVKAINNIYFDISNENIVITKPVNDFEVAVNSNEAVCHPASATYKISLGETGNFKERIDLTVEDLPIGVVAQFSNPAPTVPAEITLTVSNLADSIRAYDFNLILTGSTGTKTRKLTLSLANHLPQQVALTSPKNDTINIGENIVFSWEQDALAVFYNLEIATDLSFAQPTFLQKNILTTSFELEEPLRDGTLYFWRVRSENACGTGDYSEIFRFKTVSERCDTYSSRDLPITIPSLFKSTVVSVVNIPESGKLTSIQLKNLQITHTFIADLSIELESPSGKKVQLINEICFLEKDLTLSFSDDAAISYDDIPCPPNSKLVQPLETFTQLKGSEIKGNWKLIVKDNALLDGGRINNWVLNICYETAQPLTLAANKSSVSCAGGTDGMASVSPVGGSGNYTFLWSNGSTSSIIEGLNSGAYAVTISDGINSKDTLLLIEAPSPLIIDAAIVKEGCIGENNGTINLSVSGGTPNYQYFWNDEFFQNTATATGLGGGIYTVTVIDNSGCSLTQNIKMPTVNPIELINVEVDGAINGEANGTIRLEAIGGTGVLSPFWFKGDSLVGNTFEIEGLTAGNYSLNITDENDCRFSQDFSIDFLTNNQEIQVISSINIFPNPSHGKITIDVVLKEKKNYSIEIIDIMGRSVLSSRQNKAKHIKEEIDLIKLPSGLYFVNIKFEEGVMSRKILLAK